MIKQEDVQSELKINDFYFSEIEFKNDRIFGGSDVSITYNISNEKLTDGTVRVLVTVITEGKEQGLYLKITAVGVFDASMVEDKDKREFMEKIASVTAIMPYLRSQVAILTTQPGISQLILPPIDIYKLVSEQDKQNAQR